MNDQTFNDRLTSQVNFDWRLQASVERAVDVLRSDIFLYLVVIDAWKRIEFLNYIRSDSKLAGDPSKWTIRANALTSTWHICDETSTDEMTSRFGSQILERKSETEWHLKEKKFFMSFNYFIDVQHKSEADFSSSIVTYQIMKSEAFDRASMASYEWTVTPDEKGLTTVSLLVRSLYSHKRFTSDLHRCLENLSNISDVAEYRLNVKADIAKRAEEKRLTQERKDAELAHRAEMILLAKEKVEQERVEHEFRMNHDLCIKCGKSCVQRRRKSDGHLFFGCSEYFSAHCRGARPIPCPICRTEMIERKREAGGTFLGCSKWPNCKGSRSVDARLASDRGVGTSSRQPRHGNSSSFVREKVDPDVGPNGGLNRGRFDEHWWEEWGDALHSEDPRENPSYYNPGFLDGR